MTRGVLVLVDGETSSAATVAYLASCSAIWHCGQSWIPQVLKETFEVYHHHGFKNK